MGNKLNKLGRKTAASVLRLRRKQCKENLVALQRRRLEELKNGKHTSEYIGNKNLEPDSTFESENGNIVQNIIENDVTFGSEMIMEKIMVFRQDLEREFQERVISEIDELPAYTSQSPEQPLILDLDQVAHKPANHKPEEFFSAIIPSPYVEIIEPTFITLEGHRIVDVDYLYNNIVKMLSHDCMNSDGIPKIKLIEEIRHGLKSTFKYLCVVCKRRFMLGNSKKTLNARSISGFMGAGYGSADLNKFTQALDLPVISNRSFDRIQNRNQDKDKKGSKQSKIAKKVTNDVSLKGNKPAKDNRVAKVSNNSKTNSEHIPHKCSTTDDGNPDKVKENIFNNKADDVTKANLNSKHPEESFYEMEEILREFSTSKILNRPRLGDTDNVTKPSEDAEGAVTKKPKVKDVVRLNYTIPLENNDTIESTVSDEPTQRSESEISLKTSELNKFTEIKESEASITNGSLEVIIDGCWTSKFTDYG